MARPQFSDTVLDLNFYRDWLAHRQKARAKDKTRASRFVTISREFGCEGFEIAEKLVARLSEETGTDWNLFTRSQIEQLIGNDKIAPEMIHEVSETPWSFKDWFVDALVPDYLQSPSTQVFEKMRKLILNLADKGDCVILGAGSQVITQRLDPKKFFGAHIRVVASHLWRTRRMERLQKLGRADAEKMLRERQDSRDKFMADFTNFHAADPSLYHLIFNNARNEASIIAETVVAYLRIHGQLDREE